MTGLSSMPVKAKYNNNLKIIRPFLSLEKKDLKYVTLNYFKTYIKDPSNEDEKFLILCFNKKLANDLKESFSAKQRKNIAIFR